MKKLFTAIAAFFVLAGVSFASENLLELNVNLPMYNMEGFVFKSVGAGIHSTTLVTDKIGLGVSLDVAYPYAVSVYSYKMRLADSGLKCFLADANIGCAFRFIDKEKFSAVVTPGLGFSLFTLNNTAENEKEAMINSGVSVLVAGSYKFNESIYITGNIDAAFYFFSYVITSKENDFSSYFSSLITPSVGVTFKF